MILAAATPKNISELMQSDFPVLTAIIGMFIVFMLGIFIYKNLAHKAHSTITAIWIRQVGRPARAKDIIEYKDKDCLIDSITSDRMFYYVIVNRDSEAKTTTIKDQLCSVSILKFVDMDIIFKGEWL
jgi:hypothetical protein